MPQYNMYAQMTVPVRPRPACGRQRMRHHDRSSNYTYHAMNDRNVFRICIQPRSHRARDFEQQFQRRSGVIRKAKFEHLQHVITCINANKLLVPCYPLSGNRTHVR